MCKVKWSLQIKISTELKMNFSVVVEYQHLSYNYVALIITKNYGVKILHYSLISGPCITKIFMTWNLKATASSSWLLA